MTHAMRGGVRAGVAGRGTRPAPAGTRRQPGWASTMIRISVMSSIA